MTVIKVENLGKKYTIGTNGAGTDGLRHAIHDLFTSPFRALRRTTGDGPRSSLAGPPSAVIDPSRGLPSSVGGRSTDFWALKDVSFEVNQGEVVGIIGRNGAGKSTLLKILSRITEPTTGRLGIRGRVASLLEVGTGFHPELTGRENVFLNGAILGMGRAEINRKFDEIVAFAEVEQFIDTPVKRYSSGMYVRLAFAVAAHLEPKILIIDEVLAVGDAQFQKKCLGKMGRVAEEGRTVLFVSHNLAAVSQLCTKGIVLEQGQLAFSSSASEATHFYNEKLLRLVEPRSQEFSHVVFHEPENATGQDFAVTKVEAFDRSGKPKPLIATWDELILRISFFSHDYVPRGSVTLEISALDGSKLLLLSTQPDGTMALAFRPGEQSVECSIEQLPLAAGEYIFGAGLAIPQEKWLWRQENLGTLTVVPKDIYGSGFEPRAPRSLLAVPHKWSYGPISL